MPLASRARSISSYSLSFRTLSLLVVSLRTTRRIRLITPGIKVRIISLRPLIS